MRMRIRGNDPSSIIAHVFPVSWFSKLKQKLEKPETISEMNESKNSTFPSSSTRFHSMKIKKEREKEFERERDLFRVDPGHVKFEDVIKVKATKKGKANHSNKVCSPRTECKIRALEEMRRTRMKMKMAKEEGERKSTYSFAVSRNSLDPERDFRESMVEMIREEGIRGTEDLELLLACYLDLNSRENHGIIIKVFKHVWFELRGCNNGWN